MLRGAVTFGEDFEENYMKQIFDLNKGMTQAISHYSRYQDAGKTISITNKYEYTGEKQITAEDKIRQFYKYTTRFLWGTALALFLVTNITLWRDYYSSQYATESSVPEVSAETSIGGSSGKETDE